MRILHRKLVRDLWRLRLQAAAIALLVACGVSVAVMASSARAALVVAQERYYQETNFADVFATATRAPRALVERLAAIDGVLSVDARAAKAGLMEIAGSPRPATAELIALPDDDRAALNRLVVMEGRLPDPTRADEVVALKTFLDAADLPLGASPSMVIDGRRMTFRIVGSVLSPEFVYVPGSSSTMPDDAHQGMFWAPRIVAERATGLGGSFSTVSLRLAAGASAPAAVAAVDRILAPYGGRPAVLRADQVSNKFQTDRIDRFRIIAMVMPPVFLVVAAALVHLVLGRMVDAEREQIGLLKAFGYTNSQVAVGYLEMAAIIGLAGVAAGGIAGDWVAALITTAIGAFMRFPRLDAQFSWAAFGVAGACSIGAAVSGSLLAVERAVRLSPAVAMQPLAPAVFRRGLLERWSWWAALDQPTRIIIRNLERFPLRAALTSAGLGVSLTLLVGSQFMYGSLDAIVDQAYFQARRWTEQVSFANALDGHALVEIGRIPGVVEAEPVRSVAAVVTAGGQTVRAGLMGLDADSTLARPLSAAGDRVPFVGRGLVLSDAVADRLGVRPGDWVDLQITDGRRPEVRLPVTGIAREYAGRIIFMARSALNDVMSDGNAITSTNVLLASDAAPAFYRAIERMPGVVGVSSREDTISQWRVTVAKTMTVEMSFFLGFAGAIAFGIAYNMGRVALAERARAHPTFRVLGFDQKQCLYILLGELLFLALAAAPIGVLGGVGLAHTLAAAFAQQDLKLPMVIQSSGYGMSFAMYLIALLVAAIPVARRIWTLDLVRVLKTRE